MAVIGPFDFHGGYSPGYEFTTLPTGKGYATVMQNCRIRSGYVVPRWSVTQFFTSSVGGTILSVIGWIDTANSKTALVATIGNSLVIADASSLTPQTSTLTFTDRTGALAAASLSGLTTYDSLNNILVGSGNSLANGVPFKVTAYNANGAALGGSPPYSDCVKQVNNFMFLSRNLSAVTSNSKVYWSNVNDPETWTASNVLEFSKNDGEPIMALGSIGTDLYIFKRTSIGRLSTVTITVSGAVTLGPLVTVVKGRGCCGPRAIDNLPNGNIVFLGFDGHLYEFDGSTTVDLSKEEYPGHDAYNSGQFSTGAYTNYGTKDGVPDENVFLKTIRGINEVWIAFKTSTYNQGPKFVIYDFEQKIWQGNRDADTGLSSLSPLCMTTLPLSSSYVSTNAFESWEFPITGHPSASGFGQMFSHGNPTKPYPTNDLGSGSVAVPFQIGTSIELGKEGAEFIPRSICFETSQTTASNATLSDFIVKADFDVYNTATTIYTASLPAILPVRVFARINFKQDSVGTNVFPLIISILFKGSGTGSGVSTGSSDIFRLGKFWLSDEIIR